MKYKSLIITVFVGVALLFSLGVILVSNSSVNSMSNYILVFVLSLIVTFPFTATLVFGGDGYFSDKIKILATKE